jgi:hypothetical protein
MDCRTFHRNLEDYLEGGLDFTGRFGMERHAQQCIGCGKELAGAQRLHRMASELVRVKAPSDFEASVLNKIAERKSHRQFSGIRGLWIYGFEFPSLRKLAIASSGVIALAFGAYFILHKPAPNVASFPPKPVIVPAAAPAKELEHPVNNPVKIVEAKKPAVAKAPRSAAKKPEVLEVPQTAETLQPSLPLEPVDFRGSPSAETEFVEYEIPGPDNQPVVVRFPMPKKIRMRYGQASLDYFIQNVSH